MTPTPTPLQEDTPRLRRRRRRRRQQQRYDLRVEGDEEQEFDDEKLSVDDGDREDGDDDRGDDSSSSDRFSNLAVQFKLFSVRRPHMRA